MTKNEYINYLKFACRKALPYNWEDIYDKATQKVIDKNLLDLHPSAFKGYTTKMVKRLAIDVWRRKKPEITDIENVLIGYTEGEDTETLSNLPIWQWVRPQDKELYSLYLEGYSNTQISDILGKTPNYWKGKIWRITNKIRKQWKQ